MTEAQQELLVLEVIEHSRGKHPATSCEMAHGQVEGIREALEWIESIGVQLPHPEADLLERSDA